MLAHYYGTKVADGFFHSFSGWVSYLVAAALLFATGWLIDKLSKVWMNKQTKSLAAGYRPIASSPTLNELNS